MPRLDNVPQLHRTPVLPPWPGRADSPPKPRSARRVLFGGVALLSRLPANVTDETPAVNADSFDESTNWKPFYGPDLNQGPSVLISAGWPGPQFLAKTLKNNGFPYGCGLYDRAMTGRLDAAAPYPAVDN